MRTAKPCGPDAPTLAFKSPGSTLLRGDGGKKAGHRGEHGISRKPLRGGCRAFSGELAVNTRVHSIHYFRTRGCGCTGHPAFPTPSLGGEFCKTRAHRAAGTRRCVSDSVIPGRALARTRNLEIPGSMLRIAPDDSSASNGLFV